MRWSGAFVRPGVQWRGADPSMPFMPKLAHGMRSTAFEGQVLAIRDGERARKLGDLHARASRAEMAWRIFPIWV